MLKLYAMARDRLEIVQTVEAVVDFDAQAHPQPAIHQDELAPVVMRGDRGRRFVRDMTWGMAPQAAVGSVAGGMAAARGGDGYVFDLSDSADLAWRPYMEASHRCLIPMTAFCVSDLTEADLRKTWLALSPERPLAFFAGIWAPIERGGMSGREPGRYFARLATGASADVERFGATSMPVILTQPVQWTRWLSDASWSDVADLQQPLLNGRLQPVAFDAGSDPLR